MKRNALRWLTARPIAHRGLHDIRRGRPENTLAAFEAAIEARYAIECDLQISSDGVPIVFHDGGLERLTGEPGCIRDRTAEELGTLRVIGTAERIPTFDELLTLTAGRVPLVIELKHIAGRDAGLAFAAVEKLHRYAGPAALMSFDPRLIAEVKVADPYLPRGLTAAGNWRRALRLAKWAISLRVDFVSYAVDDLPTPMPILARHVLGLPLVCWTVGTAAQAENARRWTDQMTFEGFAP
jgi:glycerophosphoryl diester phosphodiesterase